MSPRLLVIGEALVDIVTDAQGERSEHVGGSPANVAVGLARLDHLVDFASCLGRDERGERISAHLTRHGVHVLPESFGEAPTSTALAVLDHSGAATYEFDLHWDLPPIRLPEGTAHIHTGSIGTVLTPGAESVTSALQDVRAQGTVSYDPNIRPGIMGDLDAVRVRVEELVALSDVVKASEDDLALLYADQSPQDVMAHWVGLGAALTVVTLGADGVMFRVCGDETVKNAPTRAEQVVDTVGAGDSFMAGLVSGLVVVGLLGGPDARARLRAATLEDVEPAVSRGLSTSGVTVGKAGAYAPSLDEL
ncbi:PfkB family carbohydrate kinase [Nostocoides sp. HKS02]|uniref:PfkB family carbohydrate kinase n=1 Tax=Nostocoides sp. HKS02 TaxID=1813880 RepID=UPI0012B4DB31|nr:PfkB family carbohydrate kinase [Tetrasphaera sp. HKS02]QGN58189.1 carbohydrate kinase [Tetrasphaera sp. HKS02]